MTTPAPKLRSEQPFNKEYWQLKVIKLKDKFPQLTDQDLKFKEGKIEEIIDRLHESIGKTISKTKKGFEKFIHDL